MVSSRVSSTISRALYSLHCSPAGVSRTDRTQPLRAHSSLSYAQSSRALFVGCSHTRSPLRVAVEIAAEPAFDVEGVEVEEHARDHDARVIASAVSVGEVLNAIRTPGGASITAFTSASSIGVCAGS